jgi:hypothetical protein
MMPASNTKTPAIMIGERVLKEYLEQILVQFEPGLKEDRGDFLRVVQRVTYRLIPARPAKFNSRQGHTAPLS